jgi:hypothetical protein
MEFYDVVALWERLSVDSGDELLERLCLEGVSVVGCYGLWLLDVQILVSVGGKGQDTL